MTRFTHAACGGIVIVVLAAASTWTPGAAAGPAPQAPAEAPGGRQGHAMPAPEDPDRADADVPELSIPDVEVLDQDGRRLRFHSDLVKDQVVAIQFIFTTCTTICKPLSAVFSQLQSQLGPESAVRLISISVDPGTDVPERLKAYGQRFHAGPGWTFVTGEKGRIDALLRALGAYAPDKTRHTPFVLVGNDKTGRWLRTYGLSSPDELMKRIADVAGAKDRAWFTDLPVVDQDGNRLRFYTDVLEGKVVVVDFIFTRCTSICPILTSTMKGVQERLEDVVGEEVRLVSISVDPEYDTPETLQAFAGRYRAGPGWLFLTGKKENMDWVAYKLGAYAPDKEMHSSLYLIGDAVTGRWSKVLGTTPPAEIAAIVRNLLAQR